MALPTNIQPGATGHAALHNTTNLEVNRIAELVDEGNVSSGTTPPDSSTPGKIYIRKV